MAATMTTAPFNFTLDVPILVTADLDGDTVTLRTDTDTITRDVADALRRLADSIAPAEEPAAEHPAIAEARAGRRVAIMLDDLQQAESKLADIADVVDLGGATYRRVNGDHRLDFPSGGSIAAVDGATIRGRGFDTVVLSRDGLVRFNGALLAKPALATAPEPRILTL